MSMGEFGLGAVLEAKDLFSGTFRSAGTSLREFVGATSTSGQSITSNLKTMGIGLSVFAAGIGGLALLGPPLEKLRSFQAGISEVTTLTDEATLSYDKLFSGVLEQNARFGGGLEKQTKAIYQGISAGASNASEATALMTASNKLAIGGVTDVSTALDGLTSTLNAYGMSFEKAGEVSDAFFVAIKGGKTTAAELGATVGRVAPTASALGVSVDQLLASMSAITTKGLKTEEAATGLKAALTNIIRPTSDAAAEAGRLGIKFTAAELRAKGLPGFLNQITSSSKFNADSLSKLFGSVEGLNAVLALTANGSKTFNAALENMASKAGQTDKAFDKMAGTLKFQGQRFDALKENAMVLIGDVLEPMAAASVSFGNRLLEAFNNLPQPVIAFLVKGFAMVSTLLAVVGGAIALKAAFGIAAAALSSAGITLGAVAAAAGPVIAVIGAIALGFYAIREAYDRNLGGLGTMADGLFGRVKLGWQALSQAFLEGGFSGSVRDELNKADNAGLKNFVIRAYITVQRIKELFSQLSAAFFDTINAAEPVWAAFRKALDGLGEAFGGLFSKIDPGDAKKKFGEFGATGRSIGEILGKIALLVVEGATAFIKLVTAMKPVVSAAGEVIEYLGGMKTVVKLLGVYLGYLATEAAVNGAASLLKLGSSGLSAAAGIGRAASTLGAFAGVNVSGLASGFGASMSSMVAAAGPAALAIAAVAVAIGGLYMAYKRYQELDAKSHGHGMAYWWVNAKHNLGITNDTEYYNQREALTQENQGKVDDWNKRLEGRGPDVSPPAGQLPPGVQGADLFATVAAASAPAGPSVSREDLFATVEAAAKAAPPPAQSFALKVSLDGQELAARLEEAKRSTSDQNFSGALPVSG